MLAPRRRLSLPLCIGLAVFAAFTAVEFFSNPPDWPWLFATGMLIAWITFLGLYLALSLFKIAYSDMENIRWQSKREDEGRIPFLIFAVAIPVMCLFSIFIVLHDFPRAERQPVDVLLAFVTIVLSWAALHTIFAFHYAHEFYAAHRERSGGLNFPHDFSDRKRKEPPTYRDFLYFSFVIGFASQVSDVSVGSRAMRYTVLWHSILSFIFNVMLLALSINIAASMILNTGCPGD